MVFVLYVYTLPVTFILDKIALLPLILYAWLAVAASIDAAIEHRNLPAVFVLPFIFLFMHVSYGTGMIKSIVKRNNAYKMQQKQESVR